MAYAFGASATQPPSAPTVCGDQQRGRQLGQRDLQPRRRHHRADGRGAERQRHGRHRGGLDRATARRAASRSARAPNYTADPVGPSGLASSVLTRASATLANGTCSDLRHADDDHRQPRARAGWRKAATCYTLTGTDRVGNAASVSTTVEVDKTAAGADRERPGRRQRRGGGDLQRHRRRLGRERGHGPAQARHRDLHPRDRHLRHLRGLREPRPGRADLALHRQHRQHRSLLRVRVHRLGPGRQLRDIGGRPGQGQHGQTDADLRSPTPPPAAPPACRRSAT